MKMMGNGGDTLDPQPPPKCDFMPLYQAPSQPSNLNKTGFFKIFVVVVVLLRHALILNILLHFCIPELHCLEARVRTSTLQCTFRSLDGRW